MAPRMPPSARPAPISRRITRHQSRSVTSPSASARMTSVEACDPELPPLEMISGTNSASTTARAISFSKKPIAVAVSISPRNSTVSQPARFCTIRRNAMSMYGSSSASDPPSFWMSSVASLLGHVEHVVDGDDADQHAGGVGDRQRRAVLVAEHAHRGFLIVGRLQRDEPAVHQVLHACWSVPSAGTRECGCRRSARPLSSTT